MADIVKRDIRQLNLQELQLVMNEIGEPKYRAKQVYEWLWQKGASNFSQMTNLSKHLRKQLEANFHIRAIDEDVVQKSG